jgi:hypothetical protein
MFLRFFIILITILEAPFILKANNPTSFELSFNDLTIYGKSNINNFSFTLDKNPCSSSKSEVITNIYQKYIEFLIPVNRFKTLNKHIQDDFLKMIKADAYPYIRLSIETEQIERLSKGGNLESLNAIITIADESKFCCIPIVKGGGDDCKQYINGNIELLLTDFNLIPATKFFGMVKVENNVVIDFKINFTS